MEKEIKEQLEKIEQNQKDILHQLKNITFFVAMNDLFKEEEDTTN